MLHKGIPVFSRRTAINHRCLGDMSQISDSASHIQIPFVLQDDPHNPLHLFSWHDTTVSPLCSHGNSELFDEPLGVKELLTRHGPTNDGNPSAHAFQHGIPAAVADESARGRMRQDEKLRCPSCDHQASPGGIAFESFREQRLRGAPLVLGFRRSTQNPYEGFPATLEPKCEFSNLGIGQKIPAAEET